MSSISADGATQSISLDMSGTSIAYTITGGSRTLITTWPVTINNSNPGSSSILNVKATQGLTISSSTGGTSGYFIAGTTYITFDGSGNTITINSIPLYPGFIQNGTITANGKSNIAVQNFITDASGGSTLATQAGWLCQSYFSRGGTGNTITSCTNNGAINRSDCGGIVGSNAATATTSVGLDISGCTNTGNITSNTSGGIAGPNAGRSNGLSRFTGCTNYGIISGQACGGIVPNNAGSSGTCIISKCFNRANITSTALYAGGIAGSSFGKDSTTCIISNCYNTGDVSANFAGGIVGANTGENTSRTPIMDISCCYSIGLITTGAGGIVGGNSAGVYTNTPTIRITNCYAYNTTTPANSNIIASTYPYGTQTNCYAATTGWTDASANAALTGTPTNLTSGNPGTTWAKVASGTTGNPYVLAAYNAALYSPSSASTGGKTYTTSPGLFTDPSYNYLSLYTTNSLNSATTQVFVYKGTSPNYYSYNLNSFTITSVSGGTGQISLSSINASSGALTYTLLEAPCFLEGTKILSLKNNVEQYRPIESLRKGDLVKTINNGYLPIDMIGTTRICNPGNSYRTSNRLYKCSKEKYPDLFEDLYITGCHSILVPYLTDEQWNKTKDIFGGIYVTDNHIRLMAWLDDNAEPFNNDGYFSIYHIALENSDSYMNYGIYANGLLVETCSKRYLSELSGMRLLGQEDCTASQYICVENKVTQLIDTY